MRPPSNFINGFPIDRDIYWNVFKRYGKDTMISKPKIKMEKFKPHLAQISVRVIYAGMNIITRIALVDGMNPYVLVTYRQVVATLAIAPFAYVLERDQRPPLTLSISFQIFLLALCGITITQNFYFTGLYYTSSTFTSAMTNLIPVLTFVMAVILRMEKVNIKSLRGQAKVVGIVISVSGAMVMTFYQGPVIKMLNSNLNAYNSKANNWLLGSILLIGSIFAWSSWLVFQVPVLKKYPAELSFTTIMCLFGALQSGVIALIFEHKTSAVWAIGWNIELLSYVYSGMMSSAFAMFVQSWCIRKKGPVFSAVYSPLTTVVVAIMEYFILPDSLHAGCVVGVILIVLGLYSVLWGKAKNDKVKIVDTSVEREHSQNQISEDYNIAIEREHSQNLISEDYNISIESKRPLLHG